MFVFIIGFFGANRPIKKEVIDGACPTSSWKPSFGKLQFWESCAWFNDTTQSILIALASNSITIGKVVPSSTKRHVFTVKPMEASKEVLPNEGDDVELT